MFERLASPAPDPILSLGAMVGADKRPHKLDLGIGVYVDETGRSPVMSAVRTAGRRVVEGEESKAYLPPGGNMDFLDRLGQRIFSSPLWSVREGGILGLQSTGCVAALRLGADVLRRAGATRIWISDPTWPIHAPIFEAAGLRPIGYPYYTAGGDSINWRGMRARLSEVQAGDAVLVHGCCHNPSGADPEPEQWGELTDLLNEQGAIPFIDIAYAGLGDGWERDLAGFRALAAKADEAIVAVSCSKSFGLYRERTGALYFVGRNQGHLEAALANGINAARTNYSMPPAHGAAIVAEILGDPALEAMWAGELEAMRRRMVGVRERLADGACEAGLPWGYLRHQKGMFGLLPLTGPQVVRLRDDCAIYMPPNGRICIPSLSPAGCDHLVRSVANVLGRD